MTVNVRKEGNCRKEHTEHGREKIRNCRRDQPALRGTQYHFLRARQAFRTSGKLRPGLTIPQFFDRSSFLEKLPTEEKELMSIYLKLDQKDRGHLVAYARKLITQNEKETTL